MSRVLRLTAALAALLAAGPIVAAPVPVPKPLTPAAFLDACREKEASLPAFFADPEAWKPERKADLMLHLRIAAAVRPAKVVPTLLAHLHYRDDAVDKIKRRPGWAEEFPVFATLKSYGATAVPDLIAHLKKEPDPDLDDRQTRIAETLSVLLLRDLSDERAVGVAMARARIQHEIDRFPKADFPRLKALLDHQMLK